MTMNSSIHKRFWCAVVCAIFLPWLGSAAIFNGGDSLSPTALTTSADGKTLFVACATGDRVLEFDVASGRVARTFRVDPSPLGLALSKDGKELFVTCAAPESK